MNRRLRSVAAAFVSFSSFASVVMLATQADGREASLAESNDGGAWLADRTRGGVAHVERLTRQWTSAVDTSEPGAEISTVQAPGVLAVHDRTSSAVTMIDTATSTVISTTSLPVGAELVAVPGGLHLFDPETAQLWRTTGPEIASAEDLAALPTSMVGPAGSSAYSNRSGLVALVGDGQVVWPVDGEEPRTVGLPEGFEPDHGTFSGSRLVLVDGDNWLTVTTSGFRDVSLDKAVRVGAIQQSSDTWPLVGLLDATGSSALVDLVSGVVTQFEDSGDSANTAPVTFDGCVFSLSGPAGAVEYRATCLDGENSYSLEPSLTEAAELKLVNGSVWIDALDGSGYVVTPDRELDEIGDFSQAFDDDADGEESADGDNVEQVVDQSAEDAELTEAEEREAERENEPPVANDDDDATRLGRPVVVDVLANDTDANADVLLVDDAQFVSGPEGTVVTVTPGANGVQVTPGSGEGVVTFRYWITDGVSPQRVDAIATVEVKPRTQEGNGDPEPQLDRVTAAPSQSVSVNLLDNDEDPDGDSLVLLSVDTSAVSGLEVKSVDPNGDVIFTLPPDVGDGTYEVPYTIRDEWQAEATGTVRVVVRLDEANNAPDARNDAGITVVGRPITINLLANDVDPDSDLLFVGRNPSLVEDDGASVGRTATTLQGEFEFEPARAGTFLFEYAVTDGQEADSALIRVEVTDIEQNRPPIAERDDVVLREGERRLVRALENDGDPDGDVIGVVFFTETDDDFLDIEVEPGIGFWVELLPGANWVERFDYQVSDGSESSGLASVVVARSDDVLIDAAPVVIDESVRVRSGRTSQLFVLRNDYDPEGTELSLESVTSTDPDVTATIGSGGQVLLIDLPVGATGSFVVNYDVVDINDNLASGSAQVSVVPEDAENSAPNARNDFAVTIEQQPVEIPVLANDDDPESDPIFLEFTPSSPQNGVIEPTADGTAIRYTPDEFFTGTDTFSYVVEDSEGAQSTGTVRVGVMPEPVQNRAPIARDDGVEGDLVFTSGSGTFPIDVLLNDDDPDGDRISVTRTIGNQDIAVPDENGDAVSFTVPTVDETQQISFGYEIADGRGKFSGATVTVLVVAAEEEPPEPDPIAPVANPDLVRDVGAGDTVEVSVTNNDEDEDGDVAELGVTSAEPAINDAIVGQTVTIVAPLESGSYQYPYTITDPQGLADSSIITIEVAENLPPIVAIPPQGPFSTDEERTFDLAAWVTDPEGDDLVFSDLGAQVGGTPRSAAGAADQRTVIFAPDPDFAGQAGFSFRVSDGNGNSVNARVTFELTGPTNRPPEAELVGAYPLEAGTEVPIDFAPLFNDPDENDTLTYEVTSPPGSPVVVESTFASSFTVSAPITAEANSTSFTVTATDSGDLSIQNTVTIDVIASTAGPPLVTGEDREINQGGTVTVDVVANDVSQLAGSPLTLVSATAQGGVQGVTHDTSSITFTPADDYSGTVVIDYVVADERNNADGQAQGTLTVNVIGRPGMTTNVVPTAQPPRAIQISWTGPDPGGAPIDYYEIQINGGSIVRGTRSTTYTATDLIPGEEYEFRVRAINEAGLEGDWSAPTAPIDVNTVPGAPGTPTVAIGADGELTVSWSEPPNDGSAITGYTLEMSGCDSGTQSLSATSYTWTGLTNGVRCSFRVRAENDAGVGPDSVISDPECPVGLPDAPSISGILRGDKQATLSIVAGANPQDCEPVTFEIVQSPGGTTTVPASTNSWDATGLTNGTEYSFQVRAVNRSGPGPLSTPPQVVTPCGAPLAPAAPTVVRGDTQVDVSVVGNVDDNGCVIERYQVSYNSGTWSDLGGTSATVAGLTNGTSYTFQVRAVNDAGFGDPSAASAVVVPAGPPIMIGVAGSPFNDSDVVWLVDFDPNGAPIDSVSAQGSTSPTAFLEDPSRYIFTCRIGASTCLWDSYNEGPPGCAQQPQSVTATFSASNNVGSSSALSGTYSLPGCPSAPTLSLSAGDGSFNATWSRPSGAGIYLQVDSSYGSLRTGSSATVGANNGQTYSVTAWACNQFGCSASPTRTVTPEAPIVTVVDNRSATGSYTLCSGYSGAAGQLSGAPAGSFRSSFTVPAGVDNLIDMTVPSHGEWSFTYRISVGGVTRSASIGGGTWDFADIPVSAGQTATVTVTPISNGQNRGAGISYGSGSGLTITNTCPWEEGVWPSATVGGAGVAMRVRGQ